MYDELVKRLRNRRICIQQLGTLNDYPLLGEAADAIEEQQAQLMFSNDAAKAISEKVPKWIPVTERLPKDTTEVLVCSGIFSPFTEVAFYDGLWYSAWDGETEIEAVTHWMPLPQTPKGET